MRRVEAEPVIASVILRNAASAERVVRLSRLSCAVMTRPGANDVVFPAAWDRVVRVHSVTRRCENVH